ncbi:hypothetical protein P280DRAFT_553303 [Massarina eburnea CBS 473.64]|uniref:Uncharacterized protein n=1 Tax=Massarina eburnea CBS 473.64 TaxID=1395130 RepID=A0A6A6RP15_9PLEO|nr:hypothetical protein P280DRAFT_553303 [Massarina eburnea CBS 473.64]
MIYYGCSSTELENEVRRRHFQPIGDDDALSEGLCVLDETQGSEGTAVETTALSASYDPLDDFTTFTWGASERLLMVKAQRPRAAFGKTVSADLLIGEKIIYWTMNTFFPIVQLFFESGLSCTIEGAQLSGTFVGMDKNLYSRLTDLSHEENGQLLKQTLPEKFTTPKLAIRIVDAQLACRSSIAVKQTLPRIRRERSSLGKPRATIFHEDHVVVGLRLDGMKEMGYVWARVSQERVTVKQKTWGNVRVAGLAEALEDVVVPFLGFPQKVTKPGGQVGIVTKRSLIRDLEL